jgi:hypothetical protein
VHARISQQALRLDPRSTQDDHAAGVGDGVVQQRRLPDAGFTAQDERGAVLLPRVVEHPTHGCALGVTARQPVRVTAAGRDGPVPPCAPVADERRRVGRRGRHGIRPARMLRQVGPGEP